MKSVIRGVVACLCMIGTCEAAIASTTVRYTTVVVPVRTGPLPPRHNTGEPSLYLQCDGNPAHMSDAEKFARFMGAITLLGLFAPRPEVPEPGKRLFAEKGVDACTQLIGGAETPKKIAPENNGLRRLPLILARAAHQIEAKNYPAAIADVQKARDEAGALHLVGDPYFDRSMGLSFNQMEATALMRTGDAQAARKVGLRGLSAMPYSYIALITASNYAGFNPTGDPAEDAYFTAIDRLIGVGAMVHATRLELLGHYAEAASLREAIRVRGKQLETGKASNFYAALCAVTLGLAGQWDLAKTRADEARKGVDDADTAGKPDVLKAAILENLDFFQLQRLAHDGHMADARRNFAARSQWPSVSAGAVSAMIDMLRQGATPDELTGALAQSREATFAANRQKGMAQLLQSDTDNKSLFNHIIAYTKIDEYERQSKAVWDTKGSDIISDKPYLDTQMWVLSTAKIQPIWGIVAPDALLLHAALQAKARGFKGFIYSQDPRQLGFAFVLFGNRGDAAMSDQFYLDADAVIAELQQIIPSPAELEIRRAKREK